MSLNDLLISAADPDVGAYTLTTARLWATLAAFVGLGGVVAGAAARGRAARGVGNRGRNGAVVALGCGSIALVTGVVNLLVADGGPGTGNGVVGGGIAIVLGLTALTLGALTLNRSRRVGAS
ncbi:DUF6223 family protein [Nocardioides luteus]|uniref:Uncharacterized protein n=1 Tax=Nocardioides luteus TaxID=1844 RepID=A0A1J4N205_9ACTN|nr:DUF6223 family protein [Nocardioides luteus]OIJ25554.1 hypothetical protein UG56_017320 [Nocardioides luteus]